MKHEFRIFPDILIVKIQPMLPSQKPVEKLLTPPMPIKVFCLTIFQQNFKVREAHNSESLPIDEHKPDPDFCG